MTNESDGNKPLDLIPGEPVIFNPADPESKKLFEAKAIIKDLNLGITVDIENGIIIGNLHFKHGESKAKLSLKHCEIDEIDFSGSQFPNDIDLSNSTIHGNADLKDIVVKGSFVAIKATFMGLLNFEGAEIYRSLNFENAEFKDLARFPTVQVHSQACFDNATFHDRANFDGLSVDFDLSCKAATFNNEAWFPCCNIKGQAIFDESTFLKSAYLTEMTIGKLLHCNKTKFLDKANFTGSKIYGQFSLAGAEFHSDALFNRLVVGSDLICHKTEFGPIVKFVDAKIETPYLQSAIYGKSEFDFDGIAFTQLRIDPNSPNKRAFDYLPLNKQTPYTRQPFLQLERCLRNMGYDELADETYYQRRQEDRKHMGPINWRNFPLWLWTHIAWPLSGYGVKPRRMLFWLAALLLIGGVIFNFPNAFYIEAAHNDVHNFSWYDPWVLSWCNLIPFVPFTLMDGYNLTFVTRIFAFFQALIGWILVPSILAYFTGIQRRLSSSGS